MPTQLHRSAFSLVLSFASKKIYVILKHPEFSFERIVSLLCIHVEKTIALCCVIWNVWKIKMGRSFFHAKEGETFSTPDFAVRMYLMDASCFIAGVKFDRIGLWSFFKVQPFDLQRPTVPLLKDLKPCC